MNKNKLKLLIIVIKIV